MGCISAVFINTVVNETQPIVQYYGKLSISKRIPGLHAVGKFIANELEADIHFVAIPHDVQSSTYTLMDNITMCIKSN